MKSVTLAVDDAVPSREGSKMPQYFAGFLASLGAVSAGTYLSWTSSAIPIYTSNDFELDFPLDNDQASWVGSLLPLGAMFGSIFAGIPADRFGRKFSILSFTVPLLLSWVTIAFAKNHLWLYFGRFAAGAATGASTVAIPLYLSEIAEPSVRGALGTLMQLQITIGILLEYFIGMSGDLRTICALSAVIPLILLVSFVFMPESPVWLSNKGRRKETEIALKFLRGQNYDIEYELEELQTAKASQGDETVSLLDLRHHQKAVIISLGLMTFQQLSGVNAVIFYAGQIFKDGKSAISPESCSVVLGIVQCLSTYFATIAVDKAGRRILLLVSSVVMSICSLSLAGYFYNQGGSASGSGTPWVPLTLLALFLGTFSIGFGPIPWLMVGEVFPSNVKGKASSVASAFNWGLAFLVTKAFDRLKTTLGMSGTFVAFAIICGIGTIFVANVVPETKNKTTREIQEELYGMKGEARTVGKESISVKESSS